MTKTIALFLAFGGLVCISAARASAFSTSATVTGDCINASQTGMAAASVSYIPFFSGFATCPDGAVFAAAASASIAAVALGVLVEWENTPRRAPPIPLLPRQLH